MLKPDVSGTAELYKERLVPRFGEPITLLWVNLVNTNVNFGLDGDWAADNMIGNRKFAYGSLYHDGPSGGPHIYTFLRGCGFVMGPVVSETYAAQITAGASVDGGFYLGTFFVRNTTGKEIKGFWLKFGEEE